MLPKHLVEKLFLFGSSDAAPFLELLKLPGPVLKVSAPVAYAVFEWLEANGLYSVVRLASRHDWVAAGLEAAHVPPVMLRFCLELTGVIPAKELARFDADGRTALHMAVKYCMQNCITLLLAQFDAAAYQNPDVQVLAEMKKDHPLAADTLRLLLQTAGSAFNVNSSPRNLLKCLMLRGHDDDVIATAVKFGADPVFEMEHPPLDYAVTSGVYLAPLLKALPDLLERPAAAKALCGTFSKYELHRDTVNVYKKDPKLACTVSHIIMDALKTPGLTDVAQKNLVANLGKVSQFMPRTTRKPLEDIARMLPAGQLRKSVLTELEYYRFPPGPRPRTAGLPKRGRDAADE